MCWPGTATESRTVQMVQMRMTALSSQTRVSCTTSTAATTETALTGGRYPHHCRKEVVCCTVLARCVMVSQTVQQGTTKNIVKKVNMSTATWNKKNKNIRFQMKPKYFMTPRMSALKMKKISSMKIPGIPDFKQQVTKF